MDNIASSNGKIIVFATFKCDFKGQWLSNVLKTGTFAKSAHLWDPKNGTSSAPIKILRPLL